MLFVKQNYFTIKYQTNFNNLYFDEIINIS